MCDCFFEILNFPLFLINFDINSSIQFNAKNCFILSQLNRTFLFWKRYDSHFSPNRVNNGFQYFGDYTRIAFDRDTMHHCILPLSQFYK